LGKLNKKIIATVVIFAIMMTKKYKTILLAGLSLLVMMPAIALAHQPRLTQSRQTLVPEPEISKAYYAKLTGEPDTYIIESATPFDLYVNVLVPDIAGQKKDVSATIIKNGQTDKPLAVIGGVDANWEKFYEPFSGSIYWRGQEYKVVAEAGKYEVRVWSSNNDSKYSLAIGEGEFFDSKEVWNALRLVPQIKSGFFEESPISFIKSPFGYGLIIIMYILAGIVGLICRAIMRRVWKNAPRGDRKNIGAGDRLLRVGIGIALLLWAITTSWNPFIIFLSGFAFFEALFSWCGLYAALGKNTCLVE
jgi:hypothetical protein